jgi:hypothetical protein
MTDQPDLKAKRARSPNYPGISLKEAVDRAGALYKHAQRHPVPAVDAFRVWNFSPTSGAGGVVLGALKKFGLITDEGSGTARHVRLTNLAVRILLDEEGSPERRESIRAAALTPPIHGELWEDYGGSLPPDSTLRFKLMREKSFTEGGADFFIRQFRETVTFAGLSSGDSISGETDDKQEEPEQKPPAPSGSALEQSQKGQQHALGTTMSMPLPLAPGIVATIEAEFPMTESNWARMLKVLEVMKPGLTRPDDPSPAVSAVSAIAVLPTDETEQLIAKVNESPALAP